MSDHIVNLDQAVTYPTGRRLLYGHQGLSLYEWRVHDTDGTLIARGCYDGTGRGDPGGDLITAMRHIRKGMTPAGFGVNS